VGRRARVEVRLRKAMAARVRVRLDIRGADRRWRTLGVVRLSGTRTVVRTLPRRASVAAGDVRALVVPAPLRRRA
jgi:hypothetical protein